MNTNITAIKHSFASFVAIIGGIFGPIDGAMYALIAFVIIDFITGILRGIEECTLSSQVGYKNIFKKIGIFVIVGVANILDVYIIKEGGAIRLMAIFFYLANEGIAILENSAIIGIPIPNKLKEILLEIKERGGDEGTSTEFDEKI